MPSETYGPDGPFADGLRTLCGLAADSNAPLDIGVRVPRPAPSRPRPRPDPAARLEKGPVLSRARQRPFLRAGDQLG
jgi:hypothetical protein